MIIFADTGTEHKHTYETVKEMKERFDCEFVIVRSKFKNLYDYYYKEKKVPSYMKRDCTWKFKIRPLRKYLRKRYGKKQEFVLYLGITFDEFTRMRKSDVQYIENSYPFCDDKIDRSGNIEILKREGVIVSKSGCVGCIYNKKGNWRRLLKEDREEYLRWERLEKNNDRYPEIRLMYDMTMEDFRKAVDDQIEMKFTDIEATCDVYGGCFL